MATAREISIQNSSLGIKDKLAQLQKENKRPGREEGTLVNHIDLLEKRR